MTYVSRGPRIFDLGNPTFPDCSPPLAKRSDGRLKKFPSILDDRVWSLDENDRYRYLYGLVSGSQMCLTMTSCFKYVPLEELIKLLMAERDKYIECLEKRLAAGAATDDTPVDELYRAGRFEDYEDQEMLALRNKIAELTAELEECKNTRDNLRQAMHKLENIDEIVNENKCLKAKLRCSEEMIKYLEEKKEKLEKELENLRTKSQIQVDLENAQNLLMRMNEQEKNAKGDDLYCLTKERDNLQRKVCELQSELQEAKEKQSELELLKKQSQSTTMSLEELTKENECYRKKLSTMKCLEMRIQELKRQANSFAEKYKRDVAKAMKQDKQMRDICRELKSLREERDRLRERVNELACYEGQYNSLQCRLQQVDSIIAENEMLNSKLASLDKLEVENQLLRCKLEKSKASELEAEESKERIMELQNAVADQEEEMKDLLCQIERLTRAYGDSNELDQLKEELCKKDCQLKLCEQQLAEVSLLEAEIDVLRSKLEKKCNGEDTGSGKRSSVPDRDPDEEALGPEDADNAPEKVDGEKGSMTCEEVQNLLQSSKGIISCVLEDMVEHHKEMEELERCNQEMKDEICLLKAKMGKTDMDDCLQQIAELKRVIQEKELQICCLEAQLAKGGDLGKVNDHISNLECEIEYLKDLNKKMREDLEEARGEMQRCAELESMLEEERRSRIAAESGRQSRDTESRKSVKSLKEEYNLEAKESSTPSSLNEIQDLKCQIEELRNLVEELQKENSLLREGQLPCPDFIQEMEEKNAMENLINLLQCELDKCRQTVQGDEECLEELKRLREQNCQLKSLINCYNERLDLEKSSKDGRRSSGGSSLQDENNRLQSDVTRLRCEVIGLCKRIQDDEKKIKEKTDQVEELKECYCKLLERNEELEKEIDEKDSASRSLRGEMSKLLDETYKLASDNDVLKGRLMESKAPREGAKPDGEEAAAEEYEAGLSEKHAIETTMRDVEAEIDGLKSKLEECNKAEQERDDLLKKQADMEAEIESLRRQLREGGMEPKGGERPREDGTSESAAAKPFSGKPEPERSEAKELSPEAKMREEKLEAEAYEAKAENKKLKSEIDDLKKRLEECNKEKANEAAQAQLMSSKLQGMSHPVPTQAQGVPQTVIPITEEQRKTVLERGKQGPVTDKPPSKMAFVESPPERLVKVVVEDDAKKQALQRVEESPKKPGDKPEKQQEKPPDTTSQAVPMAQARKPPTTPSKTAMMTSSQETISGSAKGAALMQTKPTTTDQAKAATATPTTQTTTEQTKVTTSTLPKDATSDASKPAKSTPSRVTISEPSKSAKTTPSKAILSTPSKETMSDQSRAFRSTPSKGAAQTASKTAMSEQSKGVASTPSRVTFSTPSKAAMAGAAKGGAPKGAASSPSKGDIRTSSKEDIMMERVAPTSARTPTPTKGERTTPDKTTTSTAEKAEALSRTRPPGTTPSQAAMLPVSKRPGTTPSQAAMLPVSKRPGTTPSQAAMLAASKKPGTTPSQAAMLPVSKRPGTTPSQAAMLPVSKRPGTTPSQAAMLPVSKRPGTTPSQAAMLPVSKRPGEDSTQDQMERDELAMAGSDESIVSLSDIDPDFCQFLCTLNPSNHKENICEIEKRYKKKMCELQRKNEDKIKKLMEQFDKESKVRDKAHKDSINSMKSGYETDIKKLVDRHKASIMRLQSLHEEEVQELNVNYETQMEAMQTQNENIVNDITSGATEKFKMLAEQHNKDIRELERKYQELLEQKEAEHVRELSRLQESGYPSNKGPSQEGDMADIQTKLSRMKKSNLKRMDMMKHKYEDLLMCERKKYEKQLEEMMQRLRQGHPVAHGTCQCRQTPCGPKDPNAPLEFNDVLQKILTEGLESLSFNEVALVHRRTCAATEDMVLNSELRAQLQPAIGDELCNRTQLMKANKEELLNRILVLENEIAIKQMETQDAIVNMEKAVKAEKKRLQDLRLSLQYERDNNFDTKLSNTMDTVGSMHGSPEREHGIMKGVQREKCPIVPERDITSRSTIGACMERDKTKSTGEYDMGQKGTVKKKNRKLPKC